MFFLFFFFFFFLVTKFITFLCFIFFSAKSIETTDVCPPFTRYSFFTHHNHTAVRGEGSRERGGHTTACTVDSFWKGAT